MVEYFRNALILLQQLPEPIFFLHLFIALITLCIIRYLLIPLFTSQLTKRRKDWARVFSKYSPFAQLQYIVPLLLIDDGMSSLAFYPSIVKYLEIAIVVSSIFLIRATLKTGGGIYRLYPIAKRYPITSYIELASLVTYILGGLIVFSLLLDKSPIYLLSGLGALTAVLMLIFQNTIKSFIAGVQIGSSNLIQEEDWIEIPSLGVNGNVISVKLHFIEVRNWDNTTLIVPTYKIIDGSFKNWRSVFALGARRIVTSINIDHSTVQTLTKTQAHKLMNHAELSLLSNVTLPTQENISNLMLFRLYAEQYLKNHADISGDFTIMTRLLDSSPYGIPLQLYCFSKITSWVDYEKIKSKTIEHLLSVMPLFKLQVLQLKYATEDNAS